jgi:hypothetical protein
MLDASGLSEKDIADILQKLSGVIFKEFSVQTFMAYILITGKNV